MDKEGEELYSVRGYTKQEKPITIFGITLALLGDNCLVCNRIPLETDEHHQSRLRQYERLLFRFIQRFGPKKVANDTSECLAYLEIGQRIAALNYQIAHPPRTYLVTSELTEYDTVKAINMLQEADMLMKMIDDIPQEGRQS